MTSDKTPRKGETALKSASAVDSPSPKRRASFGLPIGPRIDRRGDRGYPIDFSVKANDPAWPPDFMSPRHFRLFVAITQWALGCHERFLATEDERWLQGAVAAGDHLLHGQDEGGAWPHVHPLEHTYDLRPGWVSGMAQGEAASLFVRLHRLTGRGEFAEGAQRALAPLKVPVSHGGVRALLHGRPLPEEYPTDPPSHVLNGAIFALWGLYDVGAALGDDAARHDFAEGLDALIGGLPGWDLDGWSRYDLFPHPVPNVASAAYHELHVDQLRAMSTIEPRPELDETATRFERYAASPRRRAGAFARKVLFRLVVPRNRALAHRLPWAHAKSRS